MKAGTNALEPDTLAAELYAALEGAVGPVEGTADLARRNLAAAYAQRIVGHIETQGADVANVRSFGGGVGGDDTAAWAAAIAYAEERGVPVFAPPGTYYIDTNYRNGGGIHPTSGSRIILSPKATLQAIGSDRGDHCIFFLYDVQDVHISGGMIRGERDTHIGDSGGVNAGHGIRIECSRMVTVEQMTIRDMWGDGIYLRNGLTRGLDYHRVSEQITFRNLRCDRNRRTGIAITAADGVWIENCWLLNTRGGNPFAGINCEPNTDGQSRNITIVKCVSRGHEGAGYQASGHDVTYIDCDASRNGTMGFRFLNTTGGLGTRIKMRGGNKAYENRDHGLYIEDAVYLDIEGIHSFGNGLNGAYGRAQDLDFVDRLCIRRSYFYRNGNLGAYISDCRRLELEGCEFSNNAAQGLFLEDCDNAQLKDITAFGNAGHNIPLSTCADTKIRGGSSSDGERNGMTINEDCPRTSVRDFAFYNNARHGVLSSGDEATFLGCSFHSNGHEEDNTYDHFQHLGDNSMIDACEFYAGDNANRTRYGIRMQGTNNTIGESNLLENASVQAIGDAGTGTHRTITGTANVSFPPIAAGETDEQTMTLTGAQVGDSVMMGPPAAIEAGLTWTARVTATNTITIRMHNTTGSAIDPVTSSWRATVRR